MPFFKCLGVVSFLTLSLTAQAALAEGFTTNSGPLSMGAADVPYVWIRPNGTILVGPTSFPAADISENRQAKLDVEGGIKIGVDPSFGGDSTACSTPGLLSYDGETPGMIFVCNGQSWGPIYSGQ